jgi:predicted methyltransferase
MILICPCARAHERAARALAACALVLAMCGCASAPAERPETAKARALDVIVNPIRTDQDRRMDASRNPAEFIPFTGVKPGMQVEDVAAGGGYTTEIMALSVGPTGRVYAQRETPGAALAKRLTDNPQPNITVVLRPFEDPVPPDAPKLDLITIVNNYHDITYLPVDRTRMNQRLFAALKAGGHLVVVDHSAKPGTGVSAGKTLHRIDEAVVVAEMQQAGFVLEAEGAFLRNPADTRDTSSGDANLPTDKFALRFVKPM